MTQDLQTSVAVENSTQAATSTGNATATSAGTKPNVTRPRDGRTMTPRVDVLEDETGITLIADLPGVRRENLELKVDGDELSIEGEIDAFVADRLEPTYAEVRVPRYRRAFSLSRELDPSRIDANLKDGVLNLRIPKQAHAQPRRIEVQAA